MKKKFMIFLLILGIILAGAVFILYENERFIDDILPFAGAENYSLGESLLMFAVSFPFLPIGKLLTELSEIGTVGNGFSFAVLALISSVPLIPVLKTYKSREKRIRNFILILMCPLTAIVLTVFSSTAFLAEILPVVSDDLINNVKAVFGAAVWSGTVSVLLIELVGKIKKSNGIDILKLTKTVSLIMSVFLVGVISVFEVGEFFSKIDMGIGLAEGYISVLQLIKNSLHYILDIAVISSGLSLVDSIIENKSSDEIGYFAHRLSKRCVTSLAVIITASFIYNFIQIMLSPVVFSEIFVKIDIPVFSICFVLMILLISKLVTENKKLKEDNDLFI